MFGVTSHQPSPRAGWVDSACSEVVFTDGETAELDASLWTILPETYVDR